MGMKVKKGDTVLVIAGKDKGAKGKVIQAYPETNRVLVEGVNRIKKHTKVSTTQRGAKSGGIVTQEAPIHASNVQLLVKNEKGDEVVTRIRYDRVEVTKRRADGSEYQAFRSVRIASKTGEEI
jgi:large subunit ribosomal protein L24